METRLNCDAIAEKPFDVDWGDAFTYPEEPRAEIAYPDFTLWGLETLIDWIDDRDSNAAQEIRECLKNDYPEAGEPDPDYVQEGAAQTAERLAYDEPEEWEPLMNYAYPLPGEHRDPSELQSILESNSMGSVVVVLLDGEPVLSLSGGGMDLSLEICAAYVALGYYPPAHFAGRLPRMAFGAGWIPSELFVRTVQACAESCRIARRWADGAVSDIENYAESVGVDVSAGGAA